MFNVALIITKDGDLTLSMSMLTDNDTKLGDCSYCTSGQWHIDRCLFIDDLLFADHLFIPTPTVIFAYDSNSLRASQDVKLLDFVRVSRLMGREIVDRDLLEVCSRSQEIEKQWRNDVKDFLKAYQNCELTLIGYHTDPLKGDMS